jgi:photosystem II stability/assembly factor-like uncharacterized protein
VGSLPAKAGARSVLIDPKQPKRVYAAGDAGLYRSDDAGETWQAAAQGLPGGGVVALALDPRQTQRIYAATPAGVLYLSEDGATSWRALASTASNATP